MFICANIVKKSKNTPRKHVFHPFCDTFSHPSPLLSQFLPFVATDKGKNIHISCRSPQNPITLQRQTKSEG